MSRGLGHDGHLPGSRAEGAQSQSLAQHSQKAALPSESGLAAIRLRGLIAESAGLLRGRSGRRKSSVVVSATESTLAAAEASISAVVSAT